MNVQAGERNAMGDDLNAKNSTPKFWIFETHFSFGCMLVILNVSDEHAAYECMSVILMHNVHLNVCQPFSCTLYIECMSVILMYTLVHVHKSHSSATGCVFFK